MDDNRIGDFVDCLLESWALYNEGEEQVVWQTLHDLLWAWSRYELMSAKHRALTTALCNKMQINFDTKCILKERKTKRKKEIFPLNPLLKEKQKKEKEEKGYKTTHTVCDADSRGDEDLLKRKKAFEENCEKYVEQYGRVMIDNFIRYWTLPNQTTGKMHFEEERYWELGSMLESWQNKSYTNNDAAAAMRLTKAKQKQAKEQAKVEQQKNQAAQREEANAKLEEQIKTSKENKMDIDKYVTENPNSLLARINRERQAKEKNRIKKK